MRLYIFIHVFMEQSRMRQLQQLIISMMMIWSISSSVSGALVDSPSLGNPGTFGQVSNIGAIISSFLPVGEVSNVAGVSKGWAYGAGVEFKQVVRELKAWKDRGGLVVVTFGNPTNEDISNYYRLKGVDAISRNMSADQIKDLLLSFVYIEDVGLRNQLSATIKGYTRHQSRLSEKEIHMLINLLPNATIFQLSNCLSKDLMVYSCYPGKPLELTGGNLANISSRHSSIPRGIPSAHSNPKDDMMTSRSFGLRGRLCPGMPEL
jgi:hypothetical protein